MDKDGVWRTIGGRRIFIKNGEDLVTAMKNSGKFSKNVISKLQSGDGDGNSSQKRQKLLLKYKKEKEIIEKGKKLEKKIESKYEKMKQRHDNIIKELSGDNYASGTYDMENLKQISYNNGYQVTFSQVGDDYDNDKYYTLCKEFLDVSSDGKVCAGKFEGTPEVSFNVKDKGTAMRLAKKYNQISIWDWKNADEIKTGGSGRR